MQSQANHHQPSTNILNGSPACGNPPLRTIIQLVSCSENIPVPQILHASRRSRPSAEARKLAMYLVHVCCGLNLTETGMIFGRDRTTVRHACACVEDRRDDLAFDEKVSLLEEQIAQRAKTDEAHQ